MSKIKIPRDFPSSPLEILINVIINIFKPKK